MKKNICNRSKLLTICGILLGVASIAVLCVPLLLKTTQAQSKKQYPEPRVRPDISEDAVWDSELGMYISGDYVKNAEGKYELNPDVFISDKEESPEEKWLNSHADSQNEIDLAILYSVELAMEEPPSVFSAISPRSSESILTAMRTLSPSSYPEVWERICTEPAFRPQKIVALEQFLNISFDALGLYDASAQRKWFDAFNDLKSQVSTRSNEPISKADAAQFGNLLLPTLMQKTRDHTLHESELEPMNALIEAINRQFYPDMEQKSFDTIKSASEWFDAHTSTIEAITQIIQSNYEWAE